MKEVWKPVKGYEGLYEVSNLGRVKSSKGKILKNVVNGHGYEHVNLYNNGTIKTVYVHRLVANAFIQNPNGYKDVNHKDECKTNNCVNNLEFCTVKYNNNYGTGKLRAAEKNGKRVRCVETGETFISIGAAAKSVGGSKGNLWSVLNGKYKTAYGYHWAYEGECSGV